MQNACNFILYMPMHKSINNASMNNAEETNAAEDGFNAGCNAAENEYDRCSYTGLH